MNRLEEGIAVEIIWEDGDLRMLVVEASNGRFRAQVETYGRPGELSRVAELLDGFPKNGRDERTLVLGDVRLRFFCREETTLHALVEVQVAGGSDAYPETAHFFLSVDDSAVAEFVRQLRAIGERKETPALLRAGRQP